VPLFLFEYVDFHPVADFENLFGPGRSLGDFRAWDEPADMVLEFDQYFIARKLRYPRSGRSSFLRRFRLFSGFRGHVEAATVEVDRVHEVLPVPEAPRRVLHPLDLGIDGSLAAFVIRCRRYVMMFSNRRLSIRATPIIGCSRLLTAQLCHQRKCFLAGRS